MSTSPLSLEMWVILSPAENVDSPNAPLPFIPLAAPVVCCMGVGGITADAWKQEGTAAASGLNSTAVLLMITHESWL